MKKSELKQLIKEVIEESGLQSFQKVVDVNHDPSVIVPTKIGKIQINLSGERGVMKYSVVYDPSRAQFSKADVSITITPE